MQGNKNPWRINSTKCLKSWQPVPQQPARSWRVAELSLDHLPDRAEGLDVRPGDILSPPVRHHPWLSPHRDNKQLPHPVNIRPSRGLQRQERPREPSRGGVLQVNIETLTEIISPSFRTMFDNECNILSNLSKHDYQQVRSMLIETVLGTGIRNPKWFVQVLTSIHHLYFARHVASFPPVASYTDQSQ